MYSEFLDMKDKNIDKWSHYFSIYERYLTKYIHSSCLVYEIGVQGGGSSQLLKRFLGPYAHIIGIDIDPSCREHQDEQCTIRIGDQKDIAFLKSIVLEFGKPDIVIDDGSHIMDDMATTFDFLYPLLNNNGTYIVEDVHTCYWESFGGGMNCKNSFIEKSKSLIDKLNFYHYAQSDEEADDFARSTFSISFFDSIVVFEKKISARPVRRTVRNGNVNISYATARK